MSERRYKRTLKEYQPAYNPADWQAMQQQLRQLQPIPWWKRPRYWALAAILLLLLTWGGLAYWPTPSIALAPIGHAPIKPLSFTSTANTNKTQSTLTNNERVQKPQKIQQPFSNESKLSSKSTQSSQLLPTNQNTANIYTKPTEDKPIGSSENSIGQVPPATPQEVTASTSADMPKEQVSPIIPLEKMMDAEALQLQKLSDHQQIFDSTLHPLESPVGKAVIKGESYWQVGLGIWPLPANSDYLSNSRIMPYIAYNKALGKRWSLGASISIHAVENDYQVVYRTPTALYTSNSRANYYLVHLGIKADYFLVTKQRWAWYTGIQAGYRTYMNQDALVFASADAEFDVSVPGGENDMFTRSEVGAIQGSESNGLWLGVHTGIKARFYRKLGGFAEIGYQPSVLRVGLTLSY